MIELLSNFVFKCNLRHYNKGVKARQLADVASASAAEVQAEADAVTVRAEHLFERSKADVERSKADIEHVAALRARTLDAEAVAVDCVGRLEAAEVRHAQAAMHASSRVESLATRMVG